MGVLTVLILVPRRDLANGWGGTLLRSNAVTDHLASEAAAPAGAYFPPDTSGNKLALSDLLNGYRWERLKAGLVMRLFLSLRSF
jgi:hypothetical protein